MAPPPRKQFEDEEESSSEEETSSEEEAPVIKSRAKFDDEEDDSDVVDDWEAEDSEAEREKAKKEEEAKKKLAAAAAAKKSKAQRVADHIDANKAAREADDDDDDEEEEDEATKRMRLKAEQQQASINQAAELFGQTVVSNKGEKQAPKTLVNVDPSDPNKLADLSELPLFAPTTKPQFENLKSALAPLLAQNAKKGQYAIFLQDLVKQAAKELPSDQIKKIASALTTLSNEKMKEEKAAEKGGKKTKAAKQKASLVANRDVAFKADTADYGDELADDDFM